jgi:hypothetical protein
LHAFALGLTRLCRQTEGENGEEKPFDYHSICQSCVSTQGTPLRAFAQLTFECLAQATLQVLVRLDAPTTLPPKTPL